MKIVFKNMESSDHAKSIIEERFAPIIEKFSTLKDHNITLTMEMENSPTQAGPDRFNASIMISGKIFKLKIKRFSQNLYLAIANLVEIFNHLISRKVDRFHKFHSRRHKLSLRRISFNEEVTNKA